MARRCFTYPFIASPERSAGPYLPIRLVNPIDRVSSVWNCLVDTGADGCLFTATMVKLTGHDLAAKRVKSDITSGIEGKRLTTWRHTFVLELLHPQDPAQVVWRGRRSLFDCLDHDDFPPLLGVVNFLRYFRITLDYPRESIMLEW